MPSMAQTPFPMMVANAELHCGSGCMLGDICAEWLVLLAPSVAVFFGWHWLLGPEKFAAWVVDFLFAYAGGVVFQYFSIKPMRDLTPGAALWFAMQTAMLCGFATAYPMNWLLIRTGVKEKM